MSEELGAQNALGYIDETGARCYVVEIEDGTLPGIDGEETPRPQITCCAGVNTLVVWS